MAKMKHILKFSLYHYAQHIFNSKMGFIPNWHVVKITKLSDIFYHWNIETIMKEERFRRYFCSTILRMRRLSLTWQIFYRAQKAVVLKCGSQNTALALSQFSGFTQTSRGPAVCALTSIPEDSKFESHNRNQGCSWDRIDHKLCLMTISPYTKKVWVLPSTMPQPLNLLGFVFFSQYILFWLV